MIPTSSILFLHENLLHADNLLISSDRDLDEALRLPSMADMHTTSPKANSGIRFHLQPSVTCRSVAISLASVLVRRGSWRTANSQFSGVHFSFG